MKRTKDLGAETIQWPSERYLTIGRLCWKNVGFTSCLDQTFIAKEQS